MDILRANDEVSRVMQSFEKIVEPKLTTALARKGDGPPESVKAEQPPKGRHLLYYVDNVYSTVVIIGQT